MLELFVSLLFLLFAAQPALANETGYGVRRVTAYPMAMGVSRIGKVTGEPCRSDNDCRVGCTSGQPEHLKCLTEQEASNECVSPDEAPNVDYPCACLSDVNRCGFVFPINKAHIQHSEHVMLLTQPTEPIARETAKKQPPHKKRTSRKKQGAPTPLTEHPHDSRQ